MKNINERFLCLWFIAYMSLFCLPAHAAGEALREFVYRGLEQARQQINDGNYQQAHESLAKWQKRSGLKSYERAQIWNLTAFLYYNESELPQAILYYQKVLDEAEAPISLKQSTMRTLAQLYYAEENYRQAIKFIDQLGQDQIINSPDLLEVKVYSLYQLELYPETLKSLDILLASFSLRIPGKQENWLNLKQSCYLALSDYESALKVVKKLSEKFPKTRYLRSLAALYSQTGRSREQLAVLEGLYTAGYLVDEADLDLLVVLYLKHGLPERSAGLLLTQFKAEMLKPTEKRERQLVNS
ncbi:MAG: hypothetical protein MI864_21060, partial [Pseudomonadales bacterium]|nr:hypothetical protein [Pseudomonadales bacterium]